MRPATGSSPGSWPPPRSLGERLRVLVVLRADFFDRPLAYPIFGRLMTEHIVHVLPLGPSELEAAAAKPAERVGVTFEPGLLAELVGDVSRQPNASPLFQYALTELFDRREGDELTLARYEALRRASGRGREPGGRYVHAARPRTTGSGPSAVPSAGAGRGRHGHPTGRTRRRARVARHRPRDDAGRRRGVRLEPAPRGRPRPGLRRRDRRGRTRSAAERVATTRGVDRERQGGPAPTPIPRGRHARVAGGEPRSRLSAERRAARALRGLARGDRDAAHRGRAHVPRRGDASAGRGRGRGGRARGRRGAYAHPWATPIVRGGCRGGRLIAALAVVVLLPTARTSHSRRSRA